MSETKKYIDLHCHLDGSISRAMAQKLMEAQKSLFSDVTEKQLDQLFAPRTFKSLDDFLGCFDVPLSLLQTKEGISLAVKLLCDDMKQQGVIYSEIRFAPQFHKGKGLSQEEAVRAALHGLTQSDLPANLILCLMRGSGFERENEETLRVAEKLVTKDGGVVAIDLAGSEGAFPLALYEPLFRRARDSSLPFTIHAGEGAGAENVKAALQMGASRIGHGVRSMEDPDVVDTLLREGIPLEMCPTSNRKLHIISDMTKYPLMPFLRKGLKVTVNTDDMGILHTTLPSEFLYLHESFGMTDEEEKKTVLNGIETAFTSDETKRDLRQSIRI